MTISHRFGLLFLLYHFSYSTGSKRLYFITSFISAFLALLTITVQPVSADVIWSANPNDSAKVKDFFVRFDEESRKDIENIRNTLLKTMPDGSQVDLNAWRILPYDFDPEKQYPVLVSIYGGPGSQEVRNSWGGFNYMWFEMLAENGIIVVAVDERGTGAMGEELKKKTYLELGRYETLDYIETAK